MSRVDPFDLVEPCVDTCGAGRGKPCRDADGRERSPHRARVRAAERVVSLGAFGERARGADVRAIEDGAPSLQEVARDGWGDTLACWPAEPRTIKAWRVTLACALLDKVYGARSAPIFAESIARWNTPFRVLLADSFTIHCAFRSLGLATARVRAWRLASEKAIHEPASLWKGDAYAVESVRLVVDGDLGFEPSDKVLRAVRERYSRATEVSR